MAKMRLSDNEFWAILRENAGLYSRTARAIAKKYDMPYSRQAVQSAYSGGYPFSISGDIRSVPS